MALKTQFQRKITDAKGRTLGKLLTAGKINRIGVFFFVDLSKSTVQRDFQGKANKSYIKKKQT